MAGKSRQSANLTSKNNIFVDAVADNTGIGSTSPKSKLDVVGNARISGILTVGVSSSVTIDGNAGIVSATKLYAAGIDVSSFIAGAGYANTSGIATYAVSSGIATYSNTAGIATYSSSSGIATYSSSAGIATYATRSGIATYSNTAGIATYSNSSGVSTYSNTSGISTTTLGFSTTASINTSGIITASNFVGSGSASYRVTVSGEADQNFSNVSLLLHMNGSNGSTQFTDSSSNALLVTANSNAQISTAQSKFGGASGLFNGNDSYCVVSDNAVLDLPGDFTLEFWLRINTLTFAPGGANRSPISFADSSITATKPAILLTGTGTLIWYTTSSLLTTTIGVSVDTWSHVAFVRQGTTLYSFVDGVFAGSVTYTSSIAPTQMLIGKSTNTAGYYSGYIDELRLTKNVARYTTDFIPSTTAFFEGGTSTTRNLEISDLNATNNNNYLNGNLGIGTTIPTAKLDVRGNILVSGIVTASSFVGNLTGTATTATTLTSDASVNTSGIVTATKFVGDGSGLSGIVAAGSGGITLQNDNNPIGTAGTINFDNNFDLEISGGIATVTLLYAPGLTTTASVNTTGIITASNFSGTFAGNFVGSGSSLTGVIGLSTQWITTSAGIHTLSKVGIGTTNPVSTLEVFGNVNVAGTSGQLFSVVDNLATGSIFSVNDISGIPSIDVNADGTIQLAPFNGNVGVGTTRPRARVDVIGTLWASNISVGVITATTFSGNIVTLVNGRTGIVSIGIVSMTDFLYQPQGVVTLSDRWDSYNAINSSGGWDLSSANSLTIVRLNWVPSASQNGTSGSTWRTNFLDKVKTGDVVQWSKDGITWNSFVQPFDSVNTGSNSVGFYPGSSVPTGGSMYVRYITTKAVGVQALQNGQILQYDTVYSRWMPFGPYANWESTSAGINTLRSVGIGTTNPQQELHVYNSLANSTPQANADIRLQGSGGTGDWLDLFHGSSGAGLWNYGNRPLQFATDATPRILVSGTGSIGIGTTNPLQTVQIGLNNSNVITIDNLGELGIGTITPTSRLDVRGDVLVSGIVTAPSFVGNLTGTATTATALTSDASVNTSGVVTATKFVGDGSGLTGIVATSGGGVFIQNDNVSIGAASTINFTSNFVVESAAGIATVGINTASTITAAAFIGDGSGLTNVSGAGGASSRTTVSGITTVLVVNGIGNTEISGFKTYGLLKVGVSSASWVRLYTDSVSRSNDASRSIEVDPTTGSGVIAEVATSGISTVKMTPFIIGFNDDNPVTDIIYVSVKNLSGISTSISVNLTILKMEE